MLYYEMQKRVIFVILSTKQRALFSILKTTSGESNFFHCLFVKEYSMKCRLISYGRIPFEEEGLGSLKYQDHIWQAVAKAMYPNQVHQSGFRTKFSSSGLSIYTSRLD